MDKEKAKALGVALAALVGSAACARLERPEGAPGALEAPAAQGGAEVTPQEGAASAAPDGSYDAAQLIRLAMENQGSSYAPYSNYNVSAAVLAGSGRIYLGANVENASFPAGVCAERNAICHAVSCGEREIVAVAIVGGPNYEVRDYCAPCGVCRQTMREFSDPEAMHVIFAKSETDYKDMTLEELLPESFGPDALEK